MAHRLPTPEERGELFARIAATAAERERACVEPHDQVEMIRRSGLTALTLDESMGGPGGSITDLMRFVVDLSEADPIVAHILRSHFLQMQMIRRLPPGQNRDRWIKEILSGAVFGNATSEREGALGTAEYATALTPDEDGWLLSGTKFYTTGTMYSDWVMVVAQLEGNKVARINLPLGREGIEIFDDWDGIGQHRTGTGTTRFTNVRVTRDDFVRLTDPADPQVGNESALMQLYLQAIMAGVLRAVVSDAAALLRSRTRTFDHAPSPTPAADPLLLETVGRLAATAFGAESAVLAAAGDIDAAYASERADEPDPELFRKASLSAALVKVHVDDVALKAAAGLFDVGGASSASRAKNLDRHWRNIRTLTLHNPTSYKSLAIGNLTVNGTPLPANGYF
jgi:alkylation response protein AidB-like acyl-CoA dehydrogenase